ncbi:MAG: c-type cytochrome [Gammaproteobacteria bacterium]
MDKKAIMTALCLALLSEGCSRDYTPKPSATGEAIFREACVECHQVDNEAEGEFFFSLNDENANPTYIAYKVHTGSIVMPKFPNIKGKKMRALSEYVLNHSLRK